MKEQFISKQITTIDHRIHQIATYDFSLFQKLKSPVHRTCFQSIKVIKGGK